MEEARTPPPGGEVGAAEAEWERNVLAPALAGSPERQAVFTTVSGAPIKRLYTSADLADFDYARDLGDPGQYPFTRGIHETMYRGKLWTMRQFSGFGTPEETNRRLHYLLEQGQSGLSIAFDLPTLMGYDSDHPLAEGEVGKCGVAVSSLADMEALLEGLPLESVSTSMTINSPAAIIWAMYLVAAEKRGVDWKKLRGTIQNDILKEYIAQKEYIFPPAPSMRLVADTNVFASRETPAWNPISISGYHIREAGATAVQELAFTLRNGIEYVEPVIQAGLSVDDFAPRLSFFFNAHSDLLEEVAKFRAARKIWARVMRERFGAQNPRSWLCRFHVQTAGCSLTAQQPYNNVVRTTIQALAAVLGGAQSLHTNALDEAWSLPTEHAATLALRTQQVLAHESGAADVVDPLAGSYVVEKLTLETERACYAYFDQIDALGGMVAAIEQGFPQREIHRSAYAYQQAVERKEKIITGVNEFTAHDEKPVATLVIGEGAAARQKQALAELKQRRNNAGYLGMCGHGAIGAAASLAHMGRLSPGLHRFDTPVGVVAVELHDRNTATIANVPSYVHRRDASVEVEGLGPVRGDVAWGGNWFFLTETAPCAIEAANIAALTEAALAIKAALARAGVTGRRGAEIDHIELFGPSPTGADSRNFVLCPGAAYDRSPCGTGTSAKLACLAAHGALAPGAPWVQESVIGTRFTGRYHMGEGGVILPSVTGRAWVTAEGNLLRDAGDPFPNGIGGHP